MTRPAYYNEFDPNAAAWLRELIARDLIAPGDVDTRSIRDVQADDLRGYAQHHFFAGIGVWSHALRRAGWPDDRPIWTGSCPCQPFSAAGKGGGFNDERHLWPDFFRLIAECAPDTVVGEQVASKDGLGWLDLVHADLEGAGYAVGAVDTCAAGFGAPHIRQRLYWVGGRGWSGGLLHEVVGKAALADHASDGRREERAVGGGRGPGDGAQGLAAGLDSGGGAGGLADADQGQRRGIAEPAGRNDGDGQAPGRIERHGEPGSRGESGGVADALCDGAGDDAGTGVGAQAAPVSQDGSVSRERLRAGVEGAFGRLADGDLPGSQGRVGEVLRERAGECTPWSRGPRDQLAEPDADPHHPDHPARPDPHDPVALADHDSDRPRQAVAGLPVRNAQPNGSSVRPGPTSGFWASPDWLSGRDGKWRPVEPGTFPLAHGAPARVGRLRGYGNALVAPQATAFCEVVMELVGGAPA